MLLNAAVLGRPRAARLDAFAGMRHGRRGIGDGLIAPPLLIGRFRLVGIEPGSLGRHRSLHLEDQHGGRCAGSAPYANSMITASTARLSPGFTLIAFTTASRSARSTFSIFIASTTASVSPTLTSWPSFTSIERTRPGIGQSSHLPVSGGFFKGIKRTAVASRSV